jgi:hypothetical protein
MSLIRKLSSEDLKGVEKHLLSNEDLLPAFEKYRAKAKPIDRVINLRFGGLTEIERTFPETCSKLLAERIGVGSTMDEILSALAREQT